jgi:hypothetical protein
MVCVLLRELLTFLAQAHWRDRLILLGGLLTGVQ